MDYSSLQHDREAFDALVEPLAPVVAGVIRRELGEALAARVEVEDLVQETWLRSFRAIGTFRGEAIEELRAWLTRIAVRTVQDAARRNARRDGEAAPGRGGGESTREDDLEGLAASSPTPSRVMRRDERRDRLRGALDRLSPDHRQVIELVRIEGLPVHEAARRMGRSPNATSMLLLRALLQLKQGFGDTESLNLPSEGEAET